MASPSQLASSRQRRSSTVGYTGRGVRGVAREHAQGYWLSSLWFRLAIVVCIMGLAAAHISWTKHVAAQQADVQAAQQLVVHETVRKQAAFAEQYAQIAAANPTMRLSATIASSDGSLHIFGDTGQFDAASTGKLLTAAYYMYQSEHHGAGLQQRIGDQTAEYWLQSMLVQSDDTAWQKLNDHLTHAGLKRYATAIGMKDYDPVTNSLTSGDIANLLSKLYGGSLLNQAHTQSMLTYLKQANFRQYIVPAVPAGSEVYHKVGIDNDVVNDAAIIRHGSGWMVLVIFSDGQGGYDWSHRAEVIQLLARNAQTAYL